MNLDVAEKSRQMEKREKEKVGWGGGRREGREREGGHSVITL